MSRNPVASMLIAAILAAATPIARQQPQRPIFRGASDLVIVPVSVRSSGTPVAALLADDFVVTDNGVRQTVESLSGEAVPADITIVVETSAAMKNYLGTLNEQVRKIAALVRPTDRFEVLGVDTYVEEILPLQYAAQQLPIPKLHPGGLASVNDALVAALLREPDQERPHLIIAMTDTIDTMSGTTMKTVRDVARYSDATLIIAWVTLSADPKGFGSYPELTWSTSAENLERYSRGATERTQPKTRGWLPHYDPPPHRTLSAFAALKEAAEMTGGALHPPGVFTDRTAAAIFDKLYADFRHGYVLRYVAHDVAREGWHEIKVTIPRFPAYDVRAKRGYWVEK